MQITLFYIVTHCIVSYAIPYWHSIPRIPYIQTHAPKSNIKTIMIIMHSKIAPVGVTIKKNFSQTDVTWSNCFTVKIAGQAVWSWSKPWLNPVNCLLHNHFTDWAWANRPWKENDGRNPQRQLISLREQVACIMVFIYYIYIYYITLYIMYYIYVMWHIYIISCKIHNIYILW